MSWNNVHISEQISWHLCIIELKINPHIFLNYVLFFKMNLIMISRLNIWMTISNFDLIISY